MDAVRKTIHSHIDGMAQELLALADKIFDNPELGNEEFAACTDVKAFLRHHGFAVEENLAGLATAFRATWGTGKPIIGMLCEYDALAGIGHACGHHMQSPVILGAATALQSILAEDDATIVVYGTPAEETTSGKLPMAAAGAFERLDVAFMMHSSDRTSVDSKSLAMNFVEFVFKGKSSHAASGPEKGINALAGVMMLYNGIGFLREHIRPDARIHGIVTDGGAAANIVPERAAARFYIRAGDRVYLNTLVERVYNVARGAALSTGTELSITQLKAYDNKVNAPLLNTILLEEAEKSGAVNIAPPRDTPGSSDFSCVTYRTPGASLRAAFVPRGVASHSQVWIDEGKSEAAHTSILFSAKAIGVTAARLVREPETLRTIQQDFLAIKKEYEKTL